MRFRKCAQNIIYVSLYRKHMIYGEDIVACLLCDATNNFTPVKNVANIYCSYFGLTLPHFTVSQLLLYLQYHSYCLNCQLNRSFQLSTSTTDRCVETAEITNALPRRWTTQRTLCYPSPGKRVCCFGKL
jgi:hypothetical protein